jgi:hypothetical protein
MEIMEIKGVPFYLVRLGDFEHFYTRNLEWAGAMQGGKVASRMTPPEPWFAWPLEVGRKWTQRGIYEDLNGKRQYNDAFSVIDTEVVEVNAGRFDTYKVVRESDRRDSDEYWYAPSVRFYVKWIGRRGDTTFEERLREYHAVPRLIPAPSPPAEPSPKK